MFLELGDWVPQNRHTSVFTEYVNWRGYFSTVQLIDKQICVWVKQTVGQSTHIITNDKTKNVTELLYHFTNR